MHYQPDDQWIHLWLLASVKVWKQSKLDTSTTCTEKCKVRPQTIHNKCVIVSPLRWRASSQSQRNRWDISTGESGKSSCAEPEETVEVMKWSCASCVLHQECWPGRQYVLLQEMNCWGPPSAELAFLCTRLFMTTTFNFCNATLTFPGSLFF